MVAYSTSSIFLMQITKVAREDFELRNDVTRARLETNPEIREVTKHEHTKFVILTA